MPTILEWNIRHGGGQRVPRILACLDRHQPDIIVLTEFRHNPGGEIIRAELRAKGFAYQTAGEAGPRVNTLLVTAKLPFKASLPDQGFPDRLLALEFDDLVIVACYFPQREAKIPVFERLLALADQYRDSPALFIGDFNTGRHRLDEEGRTFVAAEYMDRLEEHGLTDIWRHFHGGNRREYSWFSAKGNGFRIDHVFATGQLMGRVREVLYLQEEREEGVSDHAGLVVRVE